jgi:hypothetical protein
MRVSGKTQKNIKHPHASGYVGSGEPN